MTDMSGGVDLLQTRARNALNRIAKWRALFAGWQLGTRPKGDPESDAVRDMRELGILLRVELNTTVALLLSKGIITQTEWGLALIRECEAYELMLEERFPGVRATDAGLIIDKRASGWLKDFKP